MKGALFALVAGLLVASRAAAFDVSPSVAASQPCQTVQEAVAAIQASQANCKQPLVRAWFHICKDQVVNGQPVTIDNFVGGDQVCPPTITEQVQQKALVVYQAGEGHMGILITLGIIAFLGIITLASAAFTVEQQTVAVIERFHAFARVESAGLHFKTPFIERVVDFVDLRVQQLAIEVTTKTKDDVTVGIQVKVQYHVPPEKVFEAYYKLEEAEHQITAYVFDAIRAHVPGQTLDEVYANKELDKAIEAEVRGKMAEYGYNIIDAPVTTITPDERVRVAMNEVNANQRLLEAARSKAEANKVIVVKEAEAQSDAKVLQGKGIAGERLEIAQGLEKAAQLFKSDMPGLTVEECMETLLLTQYFDMLSKVGAHSNTIMLPHSPGGLTDLRAQIRDAVVAGAMVPPAANGAKS